MGKPVSDKDERTLQGLVSWYRRHSSQLNQVFIQRPGLKRTTQSIAFAQAPSGGIPARVLATPGSATCNELTIATVDGDDYDAGDLIKTGNTITIQNWSLEDVAADGDRLIQHDGTFIIGFDCGNDGDPDDFETIE